MKLESHISCSRQCRKLWKFEPPYSQMSSHFGSWSLDGPRFFKRRLQGTKHIGLKSSLYWWKDLGAWMFKGSHVPFGYLKHNLWPKAGPRIKCQKSPWFTCVQLTCLIPLKSFRQGLQLCFQPHLNWRFAQKVMGLQSHKSPNFENFATPNLEVMGQNNICVHAPWLGKENIKRGKVVVSRKSTPWWILWIYVYSWLVRAPKMLQLCTNQLIIWFVQVHVNNWLACHFS